METRELIYFKDRILINNNIYYYIADALSGMSQDDLKLLLSRLVPEEQEKYRRYKKQEDKEMFLCSRTILRNELEKKCKLSFDEEIGFNEFQKPFLPGHPDIFFNISHSKGKVMVGFANCPVGVDIEKIVDYDKKTLLEISKTVFNQEDINWLRQSVGIDCQQRFTKLWTLKESVIKAVGVGFGYDTRKLLVGDIAKSEFEFDVDGQKVTSLFSVYNEEFYSTVSYIN